ncbi:hypothetical protein D3C76_1645340 [compost metagenome]
MFFVLLITGSWADLQRINFATGAAASIDPIATQLLAEFLVLGFRVNEYDFSAFHIFAERNMFYSGRFTHACYAHNDNIGISTISAALPQIYNN